MVFGIIILKSARDKGHTEPGTRARVVAGAGVVAGLALLVVYMGLTYLGATTARFFDLTVNRTFLVIAIVRNLMGQGGIILFAIVVALACITTAVALVSSAADFFSSLSGGKISYQALVVVFCVFSAVVSDFGLDQIISIASPHPGYRLSSHAGTDSAGIFQQPHPQRLGLSAGHAGGTAVQRFERTQQHLRRASELFGLSAVVLSGLRMAGSLAGTGCHRIPASRQQCRLLRPGIPGRGSRSLRGAIKIPAAKPRGIFSFKNAPSFFSTAAAKWS